MGPIDTPAAGADKAGMCRRAVAQGFAAAVVAAVLAVDVLRPVWHEPKHHDFNQFYMGAVMARGGNWAELYPVPRAGATLNPGWPGGSDAKPAYAAAADARGVGNSFRYIQLPPNAILYEPLAHLGVQGAYRAWHGVMGGLLVLAAVQAGWVYARVGGPAWWGPAGVTLAVGLSPLMYYTARVSNTGPLLAVCVGATVLGLMRPERSGWAGPTFGVVVGGYTKFAPGVVLPVAVAMRRWRTVAATVAVGVGVAGASAAVTGVGVWREFFVVLWPPLQLGSDGEANQTLYALACRATHTFPLTGGTAVGVTAARDVAGLGVLALLVRRRVFWTDPAHVAAACAAMLAWLLAFAPAAWAFYDCMLTPLWGWLAWEFGRGRWAVRTAVVAAVGLMVVPTPPSWWGRLPEPIATRQLFGALTVLGLATWRLWPRLAGPPAGRVSPVGENTAGKPAG